MINGVKTHRRIELVLRARNEAGLPLGAYDKLQAVVIDPVVVLRTRLAATTPIPSSGIASMLRGKTSNVTGITRFQRIIRLPPPH